MEGNAMIVRIEIQHYTAPASYWQLKRCQAQVDGLMQDVSDPGLFRAIRFDTLDEAIRHAKKATFTFLEKRQHKEMPDQMDWRIYEDGLICPCPLCQQPLYRKAKLGRFGSTLDLHDWGCSRCKKTVTLNTEQFLRSVPTSSKSVTPVPPLPQERLISIPAVTPGRHNDDDAGDMLILPIIDRSASPVLR
jgi:hypothetical protein